MGVIPSATDPDWSREICPPGRCVPSIHLIRAIRRYQRWRGRWGAIGKAISTLAVVQHRFWSVVCGADIPLNSRFGGGLMLPHPNGVVIHPGVILGPNCMLFQQVTLGMGPTVGLPRLGGHVDVGAGAKILGGVVVGDHAKIGANAVVLCDVPDFGTAVGIPARILPGTPQST